MVQCPIPLLGFAAWSGTGKTTLLTKLLPLLKSKGIKVGLIKHAHHEFEIDIPGKDSYQLRKAGAEQILVTSKNRWALLSDKNTPQDPILQEELKHFNLGELDIMLVEGFKHENFNKIELHRAEMKKPLIYPDDENIIAIACTANSKTKAHIKHLDIDNIQQIVDFILLNFSMKKKN